MIFSNIILDFYSDFLGESEIRFYANEVGKFKLNYEIDNYGRKCEMQLAQGENEIFHFSIWEGYFTSIPNALRSISKNGYLPEFLRNDEEWSFEGQKILIEEADVYWLIEELSSNEFIELIRNQDASQNYKNDTLNSVQNLVLFVEEALKNKYELRISRE